MPRAGAEYVFGILHLKYSVILHSGLYKADHSQTPQEYYKHTKCNKSTERKVCIAVFSKFEPIHFVWKVQSLDILLLITSTFKCNDDLLYKIPISTDSDLGKVHIKVI